MRMQDSCIAKQLAAGRRPQCGHSVDRRYKDAVKVNMKQCGLNPSTLNNSQDRSSWKTVSAEIKCSLSVSFSISVQVARGSFGFGRNWNSGFGRSLEDTPLWSSRAVPQIKSRCSVAQANSGKFSAQPSTNLGVWPCDSCSHICSSKIGLCTHQPTQSPPTIDRSHRRRSR